MPLLPSNYTTPLRIPPVTKSPFLESYPSLYNTSSSYLDDYSPYSSRSSLSSGLPPPIPYSQRRHIPRTAGLDVPSERRPVAFQPRPLRSLALVPESPRISIARSPSPSPSIASSYSAKSSTLRRVYPQSYESIDLDEVDVTGKDESPVVFDANLTFVLGTKAKLRQNVKPIPAHLERETASNALSNKISNFLQRTDHVMDEWKRTGHKEDEQHSLRMKKSGGKFAGRSRSATNIMIKGFQYYSRANSVSSRNSVAREPSEECNTDAEIDEVCF